MYNIIFYMVDLDAKLLYEAGTSSQFFTPVQSDSTPYQLLTSIDDKILGYTLPNEGQQLHCSFLEHCSSRLYEYVWHHDNQRYIAIVKDSPILLRKFGESTILAKYTVRNHVDEVRAPLTARFTQEGSLLITAHSAHLQIFDTEVSTLTQTMPISKASSEYHLRPKTILSALATDSRLIAVGTYSGLVYTYDLRQHRAVNMLEGQMGGLIQCELRNNTLYTGGRVDPYIFAWDLRKPAAPVHLMTYTRKHNSHQRIVFDVNNEFLSVGNEDGSVYLYNTSSGELAYAMMVHFDSVNSVQMRANYLITSSGQRHNLSDPAGLSLIRVFEVPFHLKGSSH